MHLYAILSFGPPYLCRVSDGQRRSAHRYNFIQPVDTNTINALLESATLLEHAAIPVLQYSEWFDPEQVTQTLQRVPRMLRYQRRKCSKGTGPGWKGGHSCGWPLSSGT
jgi:hypothetical protein